MSARQWTAAQRAAIEDEGGALLVSAAAGSGKTAVLVERAVRLISRAENPLPADRLLVLTFTNAAAEELRGRIALRLEEEVRARPKDTPLRRQRLLLKRAYIGTIDAFCQQLVREHFAVLHLPPDAAVGDDAVLAQLGREALEQVMEGAYADVDFAAFAGLYGRARSDGDAEAAVQNLYTYTRSMPRPAGQLRRFAAMYEEEAPLLQTPWGRELADFAVASLQEAQALCETALAQVKQNPACAPWQPALESDAEAAVRALEALRAQNWDAACAAVRGYAFPRLAPVKGDSPEKAAAYSLRGQVKKIFVELGKRCFICTEAEFFEDMRRARPMVGALCRAAQAYADAFWAAKLEEKVLDHADFEHLALSLLQDEEGCRTPLAQRVSARWDAVMVDEYQDTNELQSALYECLAAPGGENLFYVGDVKQSIYRFRQANPGIFLHKKQSWAPHGTGHPAVVTLGHNFRSSRAVVAGVNYLFGQLMSPALGEVAYTEEEALIYGAAYEEEGGFGVCIVESEDENAEAEWLAARIAQMVAEGVQVQDGNVLRACGYGDFCILLRARGRMARFAAALAARGIPVAADGADDVLQSPEVLPLTAALRAIDNPGDDVSLAAAMLGPLFRFTPDEVTRLRAAAPKGRLWGAVTADTDGKTRAFVQELSLYRAMAGEMDPGRLCEEVCGRTGYYSAVAAMENGPARRDNLQRFIAWAGQAGAAGRGGLGGFIRLMDAGRGPAPGGAKPVAGHASLLTIHKSKGLEFPFVFLADAARMFNKSDLYARVQLHAQLGVGISLRAGDNIYLTLPAAAIRRRATREFLSEEMRILYVALTRARQQAMVSFTVKNAANLLENQMQEALLGPPAPPALLRAGNMAGWVLAAALRHPAGAALAAQETGAAAPAAVPAPCALSIQVQRLAVAPPAERGPYRPDAPPDKEAAAGIAAAFAQTPARAALAAVPAKLSVSALAKQDAPALRRRPSFLYTQGLSAAEKGTAQHTFMQYADFEAARQNADAELERLVRQGYLPRPMADAVDKAGLHAFFASPLYGRLRAARRVLREYDFITAVPAGQVQPGLTGALAEEAVLVQGIADLVLVGDGEVEIADYKTDRVDAPEELMARYAAQLRLYRTAIEKRLGLPVRRLTIWSFALNDEVDVGAL
ncbi:UvrD-helicase domain-containing protein [Ruminococcaceae bacterium OttesenSCG-928-O06]|nr:UvrD-helicase domain-containing protein [Ruminococcaceae bacterium OttesenSCG-928-O06]